MANQTPTVGEIRQAKNQAVGGGRKRCRRGKNCSAACINSGMVCLVEFPIPIQTSLTKIRDLLETTQSKDLKYEPKEGTKWLKANTNAIHNFQIDHLTGGPKALWIIGNEPGNTDADYKNTFPKLYEKIVSSNVKNPDETFETFLASQPQYIVRHLRNNMEMGKIAGKVLGERGRFEVNLNDPKTLELLENKTLPKGFLIKDAIETVGSNKRWKPQTFMGKAIAMADRLGFETMGNTNMSWLPSPNENMWPYAKLFKDAGEDPGAFKTRASWLRESIEKRGKLLFEKIKKEQPGAVYMSGNNSKKWFEKVVAPGGNFKEESITWKTKGGGERTDTFRIAQVGNTRVVWGPHFTKQVPKEVEAFRDKILSTKNSSKVSETAPLKGKALIAKIKSSSEANTAEKLAKATGYVLPDGKPDLRSFYDAVLAAKEKQTALTVKNQPEEQRAKRYEEEAKKAGLDRFEKKALQQWTSPRVDDDEGLAHFQRVNNALREGEDEWSLRDSGDKSQKKLGDDIQNLDYALGKLPKNSARETFYRAIRFDPEDELGWEDFKGLRPGDVINDPGFTSYSASKNVAKTFYSAYGGAADGDNKVLFVSKNSEITPINAFADKETKHEVEALLPRGQSSTVSWVKEGSDPKGGKVMIIGLDYD